MKKPNLHNILKEFHALPKFGQDSLLKDLYNLSDEARLLIMNRLMGQADFSDLIHKMERETIGKVYRKGIPATPNGRTVNAIIRSAKKARASVEVMLELEKLAYRGFIEFYNEYGGGPDSFLDLGPKHLEAYLILVKEKLPKDRQTEIFEDGLIGNFVEVF